MCISGTYYPLLVREFHANMFHKTNKDPSTIISMVKGVRIILDRERLTSILGITDEETTITIYSNKKTIDEDLDSNYDATYNYFEIRPHLVDRRRIFHGVIFPQLLSCVLTHFFGHTLVQKIGEGEGEGQSDVTIFDLYMINKLQKQPPFFRSIPH